MRRLALLWCLRGAICTYRAGVCCVDIGSHFQQTLLYILLNGHPYAYVYSLCKFSQNHTIVVPCCLLLCVSCIACTCRHIMYKRLCNLYKNNNFCTCTNLRNPYMYNTITLMCTYVLYIQDFSFVMREFRLFYVKMPNGRMHSEEVRNTPPTLCTLVVLDLQWFA